MLNVIKYYEVDMLEGRVKYERMWQQAAFYTNDSCHELTLYS